MAADETPQEVAASTQIDPGYLVSMDDRRATWFLDFLKPDEPQRYYISAREPGLREDDITNAGLNFSYDRQTGPEKGKVGEMIVTGNPMPVRQFLAKCKFQVTDFRLPGIDKQGNHVDLAYNPANRGDNNENFNFFLRLYPVAPLREEIEAFLDWIAGRKSEAVEEFETLKNEQPGRLRTS